MRYFISDIHLNDLGTFNREHRPFKNCQTFQKFLIKTWNKQATKQDEIFIVGDLFDCDNQHSTGWKTSTDFIKKKCYITKNNLNYEEKGKKEHHKDHRAKACDRLHDAGNDAAHGGDDPNHRPLPFPFGFTLL